ncbi:TPA: phage tail protein, partial [Escherichia coli]
MGKGSSKGHTPREAKDNLKSTQLLSVIDAISEGPVEGPVDGLKSVLLNSTPVLDSEGNTNISGVTVVFRAGEQEQTPPEGFESSGSETVLGTEVKYDTPITRTITSANIDRLRFTFGVQALVETTSKGDRNPSEVRLLVQIQRNGGWVTEKDITIKGKTTSQYLASVVVGNLPPRPFNIRMRRMTPDSTTDQLQNKTLWSSYTEIIDVKQCYPNTALVGVQVDSEQFGSQQVSRNYHLRGRILQVPSNYNPQTRQYSGIWDGTFKPAYSNNMAWCLWDMLTHPRYGMGKRLGAADVDKWALYVIGQHCDQSVPDGFGGTEPRITCNAYLTTQRKAWDVLSDFCSAMRCMPVWNGQTLTFVQDRPSDKVWTYNRSNVVMPDDGAPFRYSFSALKDRHNAVEVNWIDPNNGWETATELVEDTQAILRYGRNVTKMDAFGCTSRGQAHRAGLWLIKTELLETQTVDFSVGAEGLRHVPGDVIEICDDDYAGKGRFLNNINAVSKTDFADKRGMRYVRVNAPAGATSGKYYPVVVMRSAGSVSELASRVIITTATRTAGDPMNNCEFNGFVMPGGWTDRGRYAYGMFWQYQNNERAIHSIMMSNKGDDLRSVFYVDGAAFPVFAFIEDGLSISAPGADLVVNDTTYKFGATNPATECIAADVILDFKSGRGFYESHSLIVNDNLSCKKLFATDEIVARGGNQIRMIGGEYGALWRNDGAKTYLLLTNQGDVYGGWNTLRPFAIDNATGELVIGTKLSASLNGNALTATKLQTPRLVSGVEFDGS